MFIVLMKMVEYRNLLLTTIFQYYKNKPLCWIGIQVSLQGSNFIVRIQIALCLFESNIQLRGEKVIMEIPGFDEKPGIPCHKSKEISQTKQGLLSHVNFKHGKYSSLCYIPVSVIKKRHNFCVCHKCFVWKTNNCYWCRYFV